MTATVRPHGDRLRRLIAYGTVLLAAAERAYQRGDYEREVLLRNRFEDAAEVYRAMKAHVDRPLTPVE